MPTAALSSAVQITDAGLVLTASAPLQSALTSPEIPSLFYQVLRRCFTWQRRNDTEVLQASLSMDQGPMWAAALLAWDAQVAFDSGETAPLGAYLKRQIKPNGRPQAILVRPESENLRWGTGDVSRLPTDTPIVGAVAVVEMRDGVVKSARVALTGVWQRTVDLAQAPIGLVGEALTEERIAAVADAIASEVDPRADYLGSADYRRAMAAVVSSDALTQCLGS